jgi:nitric oxide reductase large subunit
MTNILIILVAQAFVGLLLYLLPQFTNVKTEEVGRIILMVSVYTILVSAVLVLLRNIFVA